MHPDTAREDGTITAAVVILALAVLVVAAFVHDSGQIIAATARARDLAATAARTGAQQLDPAALHAGQTRLDADAAHQQAAAVLTNAGVTGTVTIDGAQVTVTVTVSPPAGLLPGGERTVTMASTATAVSDVLTPGG